MNTGQESISSIMDSLNNLSKDNSTHSNLQNSDFDNIKTCTIDDIVNKKLNSLEDYVNSRVINIYQRPWNKLEQKLKLKKLDEYYKEGPTKNDSSDDDTSSKKKKKYLEAFSNFSISEIKQFMNTSEKRRLKVDYNDIDCKINSILVYN